MAPNRPPTHLPRLLTGFVPLDGDELAANDEELRNRRKNDPATTAPALPLWQRIRQRFRRCPDTEVEQNIVRVIIVSLTLIYAITYSLSTGSPLTWKFYIATLYETYGIGVFIWIYLSPEKSVVRRVLHTLGDRTLISWLLLTHGAWMSPLYMLYLWVDIGNAARYGRSYLYLSTACSAVGFGIVIYLNEYWRSLGPLAVGLWLGILMAPYYAGLFVRRLNAANARLNDLATHDPLTRLPNRPFLYARLGEAIATAERHKRRFAVLFVDLDNFKLINDGLGHEAGDQALQAAAKILRDSVRKADTIARLGGDEFVVLMLDISDVNIHRVGDNIREALAAYTTERLCASIGIATYPACGTDAETLVRHADHAMYTAKKAGKDRCQPCPDCSHREH